MAILFKMAAKWLTR